LSGSANQLALHFDPGKICLQNFTVDEICCGEFYEREPIKKNPALKQHEIGGRDFKNSRHLVKLQVRGVA
jgi:hypothetical protein